MAHAAGKSLGLTRPLLVTALTLFTPHTFASELTLDALQDAMASSPIKSWSVAPSSVPKTMFKAGTEAPAPFVPEFEAMRRAQPARRNVDVDTSLPETFDWREAFGHNYLSVPKTQGECGSCVAIALAATVEARLTIACNSPERPFHLSEQFAFSCGGGNCASGMLLSRAVSFVETTGIPDRSCFPYASESGEDIACENACGDLDTRLISGIRTTKPTQGYIEVEKIKRALLFGPLLTNMILFEDLQYYSDGVYRHIAGRKLGGHAVVLVGWDDSEEAWIVRNSWGPSFGDNGYFRVAWDDESLLGRYTYDFDVSDAVANGACIQQR